MTTRKPTFTLNPSLWRPGVLVVGRYPKDGPCSGCGTVIRKNSFPQKCAKCKARKKAAA